MWRYTGPEELDLHSHAHSLMNRNPGPHGFLSGAIDPNAPELAAPNLTALRQLARTH